MQAVNRTLRDGRSCPRERLVRRLEPLHVGMLRRYHLQLPAIGVRAQVQPVTHRSGNNPVHVCSHFCVAMQVTERSCESKAFKMCLKHAEVCSRWFPSLDTLTVTYGHMPLHTHRNPYQNLLRLISRHVLAEVQSNCD